MKSELTKLRLNPIRWPWPRWAEPRGSAQRGQGQRIGFKRNLVNSDFIRNHPNVKLPETLFQPRLELPEKGGVRRRVFHIHKQTDVFVFISLSLVNPDSTKCFREK